MNAATLIRLAALHGPDYAPVARALADIPEDDPTRVAIAAMAVAEQERDARRAAAEAAKSQAGQGSPVERLAALEARVAALEAGT